MKRLFKAFGLFVFMYLFSLNVVFGQISKVHNVIRSGDKIVKQQVEYIDPGKEGKCVVWDFSSLKSINDEYSLDYSTAPLLNDSIYIMGYDKFAKKNKGIKAEDLIVGTEHNTMYYYRIKGDSLLLLGHENPVVKLQYVNPYIQYIFPLNYGKAIKHSYTTQGLYSGTEAIHTEGVVETTVDAYGVMVLPTGDTISPVLRVKTIQSIKDMISSNNTVGAEVDINKISPAISDKQLETYRWYTKGYRYPVFETVRNINTESNEILFATSFFFPPQDHLYLDTDPENQRILDEMWDMSEKEKSNNSDSNKEQQVVPIENLVSYQIYPNPISTNLNIGYTMKVDNPITIQLFSLEGNLVKQVKKDWLTKGDYQESINCSNLNQGNYILRITINNSFVNEKIIKL